MERVAFSICISASLLALVLASYSVFSSNQEEALSQDSGIAENVNKIVTQVESIGKRVERLEVDSTLLKAQASQSSSGRSGGKAEGSSGDEGSEEETLDPVQRLEKRLATLESSEHIARLVHEGERRMRERAAHERYAPIFDPSISEEERKQRILAHWKKGGLDGLLHYANEEQERQVVMPILSVAQDTTLDPGMRVKILSQISESSIPELKQPLLEMMSFEQNERLRQQSVRNLVTHAGNDIQVQNAILNTSREDPSILVRGTASRRLARISAMAKESTPGSPITTLSSEELRQGVNQGLPKDEGDRARVRVKAVPAGRGDGEREK